MNNKKLIFDAAYAEVAKLGLNSYETQYIAKMVLRKVRHPEEKVDQIAKRVERKMSKIYRHTELSSTKRLDILQDAIDGANVPEDWQRGQIVSTSIKALAAKGNRKNRSGIKSYKRECVYYIHSLLTFLFKNNII